MTTFGKEIIALLAREETSLSRSESVETADQIGEEGLASIGEVFYCAAVSQADLRWRAKENTMQPASLTTAQLVEYSFISQE